MDRLGLFDRVLGALGGVTRPGGELNPSFRANLMSSLIAQAWGDPTPTFTRATTAFVTDFEGLLKPVLSGEARFTGARRVHNRVLASEDIRTIGAGTSNLATADNATQVTFSAGAGYYLPLTAAADTFPVGTVLRFSATLSSSDKAQIGLVIENVGSTTPAITLTATPTRYSILHTVTIANRAYYGLDNRSATGGDQLAGTVTITNMQLEVVTGQSNQNPSEYVSVGVLSAPYHGAGVDGVKYFTTLNGNTVASNVVTEATGAAISSANSSTLTTDAYGPFGYLAEGARTNRCLWSQVFSNAVWVSGGGGIAVTNNSTTAPDGTTTADTLTASGANGTLIQDLGVVASASKTGGLWLKRKTGTGNIDLTMDGGATWTTVAVTGTWTRFSKNQTLADEDFGIRIVASGDEVYAWQGQVETASFLSSDIPTTTASVTRNADVLTYAASGNYPTANGSAYAEVMRANATTSILLGDAAALGSYLLADVGGTMAVYDGANTRATVTSLSTTGMNKIASSWATGGNATPFLNGATSGAGAFDGVMNVGANFGVAYGNSATYPQCNIRNVRIYNRPQSDAYWQGRTA